MAGLAAAGMLLAAVAGQPEAPEESLRDPFWPVGYRPPRPVDPQAASADDDAQPGDEMPDAMAAALRERAMAALRVSGIIRAGNRYLANVNGQTVAAGDVVALTMEDRVFLFRIRSISSRNVRFEAVE